MTPSKTTINWSTILSRIVLFSTVWWILTDGTASSWWVGVPAVLLALVASTALLPAKPFVWYQFLRFVPFFLMHSLLGGVDVARRAFHPDLPIVPDLIEYRLQLPSGLPQVFMANTVSLLPGTLCAALDRNVLTVHVLDNQSSYQAELEALEQRVAAIFSTSLQLTAGISVKKED